MVHGAALEKRRPTSPYLPPDMIFSPAVGEAGSVYICASPPLGVAVKQFVGKMSAKTAPWTSDIWAEYARLKSLGWTQQRNAKAKNVDRSWVARRLQFYTLSDKVKKLCA